ncbi:cytochrome c oxidase assembly protein [Calidifontibacter terrae]
MIVSALTARFSGAVAPTALIDPGPFVRWAIPLLTVVRDLSAALTVGALMVGGLLVPETTKTRRLVTTATIAARAGLVWAVVGIFGVVLAYADTAGVAVGSPGFWTGVWNLTWELEILRAPAISAIAALLIGVFCLLRPGRVGQAWAFLGSVLALWPIALIGHAAGSADHETGVDSMAVHLVSVSLWVGGLAAIVLLWNHLGTSAGAVLARFSRIATWCYAAVALSGILAATLRLGGWGDLATRYGAILIAKAVALSALGVLGYRQRTAVVRVLNRDSSDAPARSLAARLAVVELSIMGIAVGLATALARSEPPVATQQSTDPVVSVTGYPSPPPISLHQVLAQWRIEWLFTALALVAVGVYLVWVRRLAARGDRWPITRTISWVAGWIIFALVLDGGAGVYGRVMFSAHMTEHMMFAMVVPIFLVRGAGVTLALRALPKRPDKTLGPRELLLASVHSRVLNVLANPAVISAIVFGTLVLFYFTPWFEFALRTHTGHLTMVIHFMVSGYLFAWAFVGIDPGPRKWTPPLRLLVLLISIAFHSFFGVALMTGTQLLAGDFFHQIGLSYVPSLLVDQQRAGTIAWGLGEFPTLIITLLIAFEWVRRDKSEADRQERKAQRDGDADLNAYNDYLAGLSRNERSEP